MGSRSKPARRLPSAILALDRLQLSGSDSERDDTLEVLLADDDGHFKGLKTHLAKQSQVQQVANASNSQSTAASDDSAKDKDKTVVIGGGGGGEKGTSRRHFAKKSTGNMAGKFTQKAKPRKSVTFAAGSSSEFDTEEEYRDTKRTTEAPPTVIDNIYMSFEEDNFDVSEVRKSCVYVWCNTFTWIFFAPSIACSFKSGPFNIDCPIGVHY